MGSQRNIGLDLLRILCIFTVVLIHTPYTSAESRGGVLRILPFANACFAFMAGMFLFNGKDTRLSWEWVKKRTNRLLLPYAVWSALYVTWGMANRLFLTGGKVLPNSGDWVNIVFFGSSQGQMWFIVFLFYVQLALRGAVGWFNPVVRNLLLCLIFAMLAMSTIHCSQFKMFSLLCRYCALGAVWASVARKIERYALGLALLGIVLVVCSWCVSLQPAMGVIAWVWIFQFGKWWSAGKKCSEWIMQIAACSMGVYLFHHMVPEFLIVKALPCVGKVIASDTVVLILTAAFMYVVSLAVVWTGRRFDRIKWVFG